ncbi:hypothetical protein SCUP234_10738 [Seiridium cupressi]
MDQEKTFTYFTRLPPELRIMVWREAIRNQDRVVVVRNLQIVVARDPRSSRGRLPALMLTCKESSAELLKQYHKKLANGYFFSRRNITVTSKRRGSLFFPHTDILRIEFGRSSIYSAWYRITSNWNDSKTVVGHMRRFSEHGARRIGASDLWYIQELLRHDHSASRRGSYQPHLSWLQSVEEFLLLDQRNDAVMASWRRQTVENPPNINSRVDEFDMRSYGFVRVK